MDEKLTHILNHVARLSEQNPEFRRALCEKLRIKETALASSPTKGKETEGGSSDSAPVFSPALSQDDIAGLCEFRGFQQQSRRQNGQSASGPVSSFTLAPDDAADLRVLCTALQLRGRPSVDYTFVTDARVRDQLLADNLRMENAALMTRRDLLLVTHERRSADDEVLLGEHTRLDLFAIAAFNQLECLTNWFLAWFYSEFNELNEIVKDATRKLKYPYNGAAFSVEKISAFHKIITLERMLGLEAVSFDINNLREYRNACVHRGENVDLKEVGDFREKYTFGTIRALLGRVVEAVRKDVAEQLRIEEEEREAERHKREAEKRKLVEQGFQQARVEQNFAGYCLFDIDGVGKMTVPAALLSKVVKLKKNDSVQVKIMDGKITEIEVPSH